MFNKKDSKEIINNKKTWEIINLSVKENLSNYIVDQISYTLKEDITDKIKFVIGDRGTGKSSIISSSIKIWIDDANDKVKKSSIKINAWKVFRGLDDTNDLIDRKFIRSHLIKRILRSRQINDQDVNEKVLKKKVNEALNIENSIKNSNSILIFTIVILVLSSAYFILDLIFNLNFDTNNIFIPATSFIALCIELKRLSGEEDLFNLSLFTDSTTNDHLLENVLKQGKILVHIEDIDRISCPKIRKIIIEEVIHLYGIKGIEVIIEMLPKTIDTLFSHETDNGSVIHKSEINNSIEWKTKYAGNVFFIPKMSKRKKMKLLKDEINDSGKDNDQILEFCIIDENWNIRQIFNNYNLISSVFNKFKSNNQWNDIKGMTHEIALLIIMKEHHKEIYENIKNEHSEITFHNLFNPEVDNFKFDVDNIRYLSLNINVDAIDQVSLGDYIAYIETDVDLEEILIDAFIKSKGAFLSSVESNKEKTIDNLIKLIRESLRKELGPYSQNLISYFVTSKIVQIESISKLDIGEYLFDNFFWRYLINNHNEDNSKKINSFVKDHYKLMTNEDNSINKNTFETFVELILLNLPDKNWLNPFITKEIIDGLSSEQAIDLSKKLKAHQLPSESNKEIIESIYYKELEPLIKRPIEQSDITSINAWENFTELAKSQYDWELIINAINNSDLKQITDVNVNCFKNILNNYGMFTIEHNESLEYDNPDDAISIAPVFSEFTTMKNLEALEFYKKQIYNINNFNVIDAKEIIPKDYLILIKGSRKNVILDAPAEAIELLFNEHFKINTTLDLFNIIETYFDEENYFHAVQKLFKFVKNIQRKKEIKYHNVSKYLRKYNIKAYNIITSYNQGGK